MKRIKRLFCFALAFLLAFTTVDLSGFVDEADAATETVTITVKDQYHIYTGGYPHDGQVFAVNGKTAWCMNHSKGNPSGTRTVTTSAVTDANMLKALYYGYEGISPWSGWSGKSEDWKGLVMSRTISVLNGDGKFSSVPDDFYNYVISAPAVPTSASFSIVNGSTNVNGTTVTASAGATSTTPTLTYKPESAALKATFTVPADVTAYVNGTAYAAGKTVTLSNGNTFYFTSTKNTTKTIKFTGGKAISGTAYKPSSGSLQTLLVAGIQAAKSTSISFKFTTTGTMTFKKTNSTGYGLSGAVYEVYYNASSSPKLSVTTDRNTDASGCYTNTITASAGTKIAEFTTGAGGIGAPKLTAAGTTIKLAVSGNTITNMPLGYYSVVEKKAPNGYSISTAVQTKQLSSSTSNAAFDFSAKDSADYSLSLKKVPKAPSVKAGEGVYSMAGAEYVIYAGDTGPEAGSTMGPIGAYNSGYANQNWKNADGKIDAAAVVNATGGHAHYVGRFRMDADGVGRVIDVASSGIWKPAYDAWKGNTSATEITELPDTYHSPLNYDMPGYYYFAIETKLPDSGTYGWDSKIRDVTYFGEIVSEEPVNETLRDPISITINKMDSEGNVIDADKSGLSLEGTVFKVSYYSDYYSSKAELSGKTPERTWYIEAKYMPLNKKYMASLDEEHLAEGYDSDDFYDEGLIPLGTVTVEEVKAAEGFVKDSGSVRDENGIEYKDRVFIGQVRPDGIHGMNGSAASGGSSYTEVKYANELEFNVTNQPVRGNLTFTKLRYENGSASPLAGVLFDISLLDADGNVLETHRVKTGADGRYSSADDASLMFYGTGDSSKWNRESVSEDSGRLIYGDYLVTEVRCEANKGLVLAAPFTVTVSGDASNPSGVVTVDAGNLYNVPDPVIGTSEWDNETGSHLTYADDSITVVDTVSYDYLSPDARYVMKGMLMEVKSDGSVTALLDDNGKPVTAAKLFTAEAGASGIPDSAKGTVDVTFKFSGKSLAGKTFVIYEYLFNALNDDTQETVTGLEVRNGQPVIDDAVTDTDGNPVGHADKNDAGQTGYIPKIGTTALSGDTNGHVAKAGTVTINDTVAYENLIPGKEYTVRGTLKNAADGSTVKDKNGREVTAEKTFTPSSAGGSIVMTFTFDGSLLAGTKTVVFEDVYQNGRLVASHADISDEGQTVYIPEIGTTALDNATGTHESFAGTAVTINDTVKYTNLKPGVSYVVSGTLKDKATGNDLLDAGGRKITAEKTFTPSSASGSVVLSFTFDGSVLAGKTAVAFESLTHNGAEVAVHADISDEGQTVRFPSVGTAARDGDTGGNKAVFDGSVTIKDTVALGNLTPGNKYYVSGVLMDKVTKKPVMVDGKQVTAESGVFTADSASKSIELSFTFDATKAGIAGADGTLHDVVVFETLYDGNGVRTASEEDLDNKEQTVSFIAPVHILKVDEAGNPLAGASLEVVDDKGNVVDSFVSDGRVHETPLHIGSYTLRETAAPDGYFIALEIPFEVRGDGKTYVNGRQTETVVMQDERLSVLPSAGSFSRIIGYSAAALLMLLGIALYAATAIKRNKKLNIEKGE